METTIPQGQEAPEKNEQQQPHLLALNEDAHMVRLYMAFTAADFFNTDPSRHVLI